jgi:hypothetical protein
MPLKNGAVLACYRDNPGTGIVYLIPSTELDTFSGRDQ